MFPKLIIFDLDGTLIDSVGDISRALNAMLDELNRPPITRSVVRTMVGDGAGRLIERALAATGENSAAADHEIALGRFLALYAEDPVAQTKAYPAVHEILTTLADDGYKMAICTNKPEAASRDILTRLDLAHYFHRIVGGDTHPWRKPDPRMVTDLCGDFQLAVGDTVLIGDSEVDAETAHRAAMRFVLMRYGYHRGGPAIAPPRAELDSFAEIPDLFRAGGLTSLPAPA